MKQDWTATEEEAVDTASLNDVQEWGDGRVMVESVDLQQIWIPARQRRALAMLLLNDLPQVEGA